MRAVMGRGAVVAVSICLFLVCAGAAAASGRALQFSATANTARLSGVSPGNTSSTPGRALISTGRAPSTCVDAG